MTDKRITFYHISSFFFFYPLPESHSMLYPIDIVLNTCPFFILCRSIIGMIPNSQTTNQANQTKRQTSFALISHIKFNFSFDINLSTRIHSYARMFFFRSNIPTRQQQKIEHKFDMHIFITLKVCGICLSLIFHI